MEFPKDTSTVSTASQSATPDKSIQSDRPRQLITSKTSGMKEIKAKMQQYTVSLRKDKRQTLVQKKRIEKLNKLKAVQQTQEGQKGSEPTIGDVLKDEMEK